MNRLRHQDGAAAVEFGLLLPLLVMLVFGIIEFSTAYNRSQGMEAAVREGVRLAAEGAQTTDAVRAAVWNTLQSDAGGSGFASPGNVRVEVFNAPTTPSYANDPDEMVGTGTSTPCDGSVEKVHVVAWIESDQRTTYGLDLVMFPSVPLALETRSVMPCLNFMS